MKLEKKRGLVISMNGERGILKIQAWGLRSEKVPNFSDIAQ